LLEDDTYFGLERTPVAPCALLELLNRLRRKVAD
jgi:hypothetical protein